jgi:hypothetical protein
MAELDRRTVLRGVLFGAVYITAGGVAITTPEPADAVPLAAEKTGPIKTDDLFEDQDLVNRVQYWRRRRRRYWRRRWWWRRRRWVCWWRRGRRVCARRWY